MWYNSRAMHKLNIAVVAALLLAHPCEASERRRPNIVFLLADDLGYGDVGFCPCPTTNVLAKLRTKHIDSLARSEDLVGMLHAVDDEIQRFQPPVVRHVAELDHLYFKLLDDLEDIGLGEFTHRFLKELHQTVGIEF